MDTVVSTHDVQKPATAIPEVSGNPARAVPEESGDTPRLQRSRSLRAWMLVPPVDAIMLMSPLLWAPQHTKALIATTALTLVLTNGRGYRARLHLSVLDELPWLVTRIATATTITATVTALRHEQEAVTSFLVVSVSSLALFVAGRVLTTQIILWSRRRGLCPIARSSSVMERCPPSWPRF
jgi:hypothetical protein